MSRKVVMTAVKVMLGIFWKLMALAIALGVIRVGVQHPRAAASAAALGLIGGGISAAMTSAHRRRAERRFLREARLGHIEARLDDVQDRLRRAGVS